MKRLKVVRTGDLAVEMAVPRKKTERLAITDPYPETVEAQRIFLDLATMHLIAPYLPECIETDFGISTTTEKIINKMYAACGHDLPQFNGLCISTLGNGGPYANRAVVAHSAGKDSLWNMSWAMQQFGSKNVAAVHVAGLNRSCGAAEQKWSERQAKKLGFELITIHLINSSSNQGYGTMRSRDLFLAGILAPIAKQYGAGHIITEGFAEAKPDEPFSGQASTMKFFNKSLREWGLPIKVAWRDQLEMDIIREMYETRPDWMPQMSNCFSMPNYKIGIKRSWQHRAPTFPLYESQCGSCVKCRITNVARILYDPRVKKNATTKDIGAYLENTAKWTRERYHELYDMLEGSFTRDLRIALDRYGVKFPSLVA